MFGEVEAPEFEAPGKESARYALFGADGSLLWRSPAWIREVDGGAFDHQVHGHNWLEFVLPGDGIRALAWLADGKMTEHHSAACSIQRMDPGRGAMGLLILSKTQYRENWFVLGTVLPGYKGYT